MQIMCNVCNVIWRVVVVSAREFIMIRLGSLEREDRNTADMAAQFTQISTISKRIPNNFC